MDKNLINRLAFRFFVKGSLTKFKYGSAPIIQFNDKQETSVNFSKLLTKDVKLFEKSLNIGFFYYAPRLWMIGEIEPLKSLISKNKRNQIINKIIDTFPCKFLTTSDIFFRLRVNPKDPKEFREYDSSPNSGNGRLSSKNFPILYGSQNLEICIHECKVSVEDELYIASLKPNKNLKLIDLTEIIDDGKTEFESLDIAINMLFFAKKHSYEICRDIALKIKDAGFDGIIYPSYFSCLKTGTMPFDTVAGISIRKLPPLKKVAKSQIISNIAIFGNPLKENVISVKCINKLVLNKVSYDYHFGSAEF